MVTGAVVFVGGLIAVRQADIALSSAIYIAAISAALVSAGGNVINDVYDIEIDRINRQSRPLPAGRISINYAAFSGVILFSAGIGVGFSVSLLLGVIAVVVIILLWGYSFKLKRMPLVGNILVSVCGGLAFIYGAVAVSELKYGMYPAAFAFLIHLSREIIKDIEDMPGDRAVAANTLPLVIGEVLALCVAVIPLVLLAGLIVLPYLLKIFGLTYLILVLVIVDIPLLALVYFLMVRRDNISMQTASQVLKIIMVTGLIALFFG